MRRLPILCGASALAIVAVAHEALAQQSLPTIDIGGSTRAASGGSRAAAGGRGVARAAAAQPQAAGGLSGQAGPNIPAAADPKAYKVLDAATATKTDTPIMEIPASIKVVPQAVLRDQQVVRVDQALQNVSGVVTAPSNQGGSDAFLIRGFYNDTIYRDGFFMPSALGGGTSKRDTANLDRIEVLKGPGSILFGRAEPGGIVNLVTKQPLDTPYYSVQQQIGSFDFYRTTVDATGPVTQDKSILYRVNMAYENAHSFRDFMKNNRFFIAPVVSWRPDQHTRVNLEFEYQHYNDAVDPGLPPIGAVPLAQIAPDLAALYPNRMIQYGFPAPVPRSRYVSEPLTSRSSGDRFLSGINMTRELNENWKLLTRFTGEWWRFGASNSLFFGPANNDGTLDRFFNLVPPGAQSNRYYGTVNLTGKIDTFGVKHTLLFGYDYFHINDYLENDCCAAAPAFNIFAPAYLPYPVFANPAIYADPANPFGKIGYSQVWSGYYFQDQIELPYNIFLVGGLRYDDASGTNTIGHYLTSKDNKVSPRGAILWRPVPWLSVYGSYTENFGASNALFRPRDANMAPTQTAQQWEGGVKAELLDGKLLATASYWDLTKNNIGTPDPVNPIYTRAIGQAETRGVEFDLSGEILPGWRVIGAYTYMPYAKITKDVGFDGGPGFTGNRLYLAPTNYGSLWSTYEFQPGHQLAGLKVGGGFQAMDERFGDPGNTYKLPGYAIFNLMGSYAFNALGRKFTAQLNIDNLFDRTYYVGTNSGSFITPGTPQKFLGSIRMEF